MVSAIVFGINFIGVFIGIYSIYITTVIIREYQLDRTHYFILTSISITIWNIGHILINFLPTNEPILARRIWLIAIISGITMVGFSVMGFHLLRFDHLKRRINMYTGILGFYLSIFIYRKDWITVEFTDSRWQTAVNNRAMWLSFSLVVAIIVIIEVEIPMFIGLRYATPEQRQATITLLVGINLALFSNALLSFEFIGLPPETRYLVADIGFLVFFLTMYYNPFIGIYDPVQIHQVIVARNNGEIIYSITPDTIKAVLTSGAIIGVNVVLENISTSQGSQRDLEKFRIIELHPDYYFTANIGGYILIFHFSHAQGVCYQKFKSLAYLFSRHTNDEILLNEFEKSFAKYFPLKRFQSTRMITV